MGRKSLRGGIVGSRFAARFHYEAMRRVTAVDVDVVGVWSPTAANASAFAAERGIRACESLDSLLGETDVVHVCALASAHEEIAVAALRRGVHAIVEKPFTGAFGDGASFDGRGANREILLESAMASVRRMLEAEAASEARIHYAENWVYAPAVQKEREIVEKTGAQLLRIDGEESHSGSHSDAYGIWRLAGGGSALGKGVHPLSAALYLKRVEGRARDGAPIRPAAVSARTHDLTRIAGYRDQGHLRTDYQDVEDFALLHVVFADGTVADIVASEVVMGGVHRQMSIAANNHRSVLRIAPNDTMRTYNPVEAAFAEVYVAEKIGTTQGWSSPAPDESGDVGQVQEVEAFYRSIAFDEPVESDSELAADTIATVYAGYVSAGRGGAEVEVPRA
jgi:predicted dehydrogenase